MTSQNKGFILDGLGLNRNALKHLLEEYPERSLHYAIQQLIKKDIKRKQEV